MTDEDGGSLAVVKAVGGSALWAAGAASSYVGGAISSYVAGSGSEAKPEPACLRPLGGSEILRIANTLNGIFATSNGALKPPEVPRLVVVGTQVGVMWASKLHVHTCTCTTAHLHTCTPAPLNLDGPEEKGQHPCLTPCAPSLSRAASRRCSTASWRRISCRWESRWSRVR